MYLNQGVLTAFSVLFGLIVGSFLNVCIYRIPKHEDIVIKSSHCMACGKILQWYEMIPVLSFLWQGGKCRGCGIRLSRQYPLVELGNGFLWGVIVWQFGWGLDGILYALCASALIVISVIDFRTYEIPFGCNLFLLLLGIIHTIGDLAHWHQYVLGFFCISGFFLLLYLLSRGRAIGGGDIKLMAAAGLLLGWQQIVLAMILGSVLGAVIHTVRMKLAGEDRVLAFGPYLSMGILISMLFGSRIIAWYLALLW